MLSRFFNEIIDIKHAKYLLKLMRIAASKLRNKQNILFVYITGASVA